MVAERPYFVTFRLKGSIPSRVARELQEEREALQAKHASDRQVSQLCKQQLARVESILDACSPEAGILSRPDCAQTVIDAFSWLVQARGWSVYALTVMPNHTHAVLRNGDGRNADLAKDLGSVKSFTAHRIDKILGRRGSVWQSENFDHWCRSAEESERFIAYTVNNPAKAGLVSNPSDWPWTRLDMEPK
jgi:REP element-mobilizing transposase RayT